MAFLVGVGSSCLLRLPWGVGGVACWVVALGHRILESCGAFISSAAHAVLVRWHAAECGGVGEGKTLVVAVAVGVGSAVGSVLLCERNLVVAASTRSEWNGERATLVVVLLWVHEKRVASIERSEVVNVTGFLCRNR
jgi:hypothetical protein